VVNCWCQIGGSSVEFWIVVVVLVVVKHSD